MCINGKSEGKNETSMAYILTDFKECISIQKQLLPLAINISGQKEKSDHFLDA